MLFVLIFAGRKQLKEDLAFLREKTSRIFLLLTAAVLVTANWLTYIWAVTHGHVIDTSIG
ncbi:MAG: EamA family transporter RarD, partial [Megasphaera micronuciformis]|nr:EamA family transporter RarD [Megasphaera micronuciformis]